jgi:hypothetical protein
MKRDFEYRIAAIVIAAHAILLAICNNVLVVVFEFPDVLRNTAEHRLALFLEHSNVIIPTYYFFALTGFSMIVMAVLLHQLLNENRSTLVALATVFGVLAGTFQVLGYIRWPILIPYIAENMANPAKGLSEEAVILAEGIFNRYVGMAVGEHLGTLAMAVWTILIGLAMLSRKLFDRALGWVGVVIGILVFAMSMEPLGGVLSALGVLGVFVWPAWAIWLLFLSVSLFRTKAGVEAGPRPGWKSLIAGVALWLVSVVPAFVG